ncbi:hypothetical protein MTP06_43660 [Streptomyces sp. PLM4]|uniref:Uncharacterized protein n=1 Tax=Streptomyces albidoflavus TaxID=1886 RepID=A0AA37BZB4_9ACTN|nr:hypothetical protein MTP02_16630 [Streptomyces albus]BDH70917.1 hypothetical protein MTP06_43660 [Streptomyces sp. PLM4]GHI45794.1 hypothetical protein ScoT_19680 [Streptomyces albidoflavus]
MVHAGARGRAGAVRVCAPVGRATARALVVAGAHPAAPLPVGGTAAGYGPGGIVVIRTRRHRCRAPSCFGTHTRPFRRVLSILSHLSPPARWWHERATPRGMRGQCTLANPL